MTNEMRKQMYTQTDMEVKKPGIYEQTKETRQVLAEVKEPGIYEQTKETRQVLTEVLFMLDQFKREIRDYKIPEAERAVDPTCFRDEVACINSLAFAIRGDLTRLTDEFH